MRSITTRLMTSVMVILPLLVVLPAVEGKEASFFKNGERWLLIGDSITNTDTYRQLMLRVLQHYHPEADIMVGNSAVNGVKSDYQEKRDFKPTLVTIMLGMNNIIHRDWPYASGDMTKEMEGYRSDLAAKVRDYRKMGADVVLMTPTYTDERVLTYFNTTCTRRFLEGFGRVVREVAAAEGCGWVPVGEEMEAFQDTLGENENVRPDGVHPHGWGQYQIARSLWEHLNVAGELGGRRSVVVAPKPVPVTVTLASRFMHEPIDGITLNLASASALTVKARWSLDSDHGTVLLKVGAAPLSWKIPASMTTLTVEPGRRKWLVVDLTEGDRSSLYVIDLARTRILTAVDGVVKGTFESGKDRPEGRHVGEWSIREQDGELQVSGEIIDSEIVATRDWPFARDGVHVYLDTRPKDRFASVNPDRDLYGIILGVREKPVFAVSPMAWLGPRLQYAMSATGEKTAAGYRFWLGVRGGVSDYRKCDIRTLDYYGVNLFTIDADDTPNDTVICPAMHTQFDDNPVQGLNTLMIVDRKGVFPGKETTNLQLFGR